MKKQDILMPRRNPSTNSTRSFGFMTMSKNGNMNNTRNRQLGSKNNFGRNASGHGSVNQVSPWLSQTNNSNSPLILGRNVAADQQAQLALASSLLNNLFNPASQLNKLQSPPSLLSLNRSTSSACTSFGGSPSFNRDRFGYGHANSNKVQKGYRKVEFKNKRFGDRKSNKKTNQSNKPAMAEKNADKKDVLKKEEVKVDNMGVNEAFSSEETMTSAPEADTLNKNDCSQKEILKNEDDMEITDEQIMSYSDVPSALLFCHICRKHMWDDSSFEKHLEGRPHKLMMEELDRSYKLKVDLLRHEMRVAEQQRENDIQRAQRKGKSNIKKQQRDFCTMCNLSFLGMLTAHRKTERHQRLKKFLHPKCNVCSKEFYTRLEWDDHKLTPAHLKRLAEIRKATRPDLEDSEFDIIDFIEDVNDEYMDSIELKVASKREPLAELQTLKNDGVGNTISEEHEKDETNEEQGEEEDTKILPKYSPGIPVGENFVVDKTGFLCRACNKFVIYDEDVRTHCQTVVHYNNIIKILKMQNKIVRKRRTNDMKAEDEEKYANKRQKVNDESLNEIQPSVEIKEEVDTESTIESEIYDPRLTESENENEFKWAGLEMQDTTIRSNDVDTKASNATAEPKIIVDSEALNSTTKPGIVAVNLPNVAELLTEHKEVSAIKEIRSRPSQTVRGPRARRGRRH